MKAHIIVLISLLAGVYSCKKEPLPEPESGTPLFYVRCSVQGVPVNLEAGNDGYRMVPGYYHDTTGVFTLTSRLEKNNCSNCYGITVKLNDKKVTASNGPMEIDSALRVGAYVFNDKSLPPAQHRIDLQPEEAEDPTGTYGWTVSSQGKADKIMQGYNTHFYADALQTYTVTFYHADAAGCTNSLVRHFTPGLAPQVEIRAQHSGAGDLTYAFRADVPGAQSVRSYHWDFGDGTTSTEAKPVKTFLAASQPYYVTTVTVIYEDYKSSTARYQVRGTPDPVCLANFSAGITAIPNLKPFSRVVIELHDPSGRVFSSNDFVQPEMSTFEITETAEYTESGQTGRTKRYKGVFNCVLRNNGEEITVTGGEISLGVAYQ